MKKFAVIMIAAAIGAIGTPSAHAQTPTPSTNPPVATPELCAETDGLTAEQILLCANVDDDGVNPDFYPPDVLPPTTTTTTTTLPPEVAPPTTLPPPVLPATGSSGTSGFLQIGALMFTGGLLVIIAARRRSTVRHTAA